MTRARSSKPVRSGMPSTSRGTSELRIPGLPTDPSCSPCSSRVFCSSVASPKLTASIVMSTCCCSSGPRIPSTTLNWSLNDAVRVSRSASSVCMSQRKGVEGRRVRFFMLILLVTGTARKIVPRSTTEVSRQTLEKTTSPRRDRNSVCPPSTSSTNVLRILSGSSGANSTSTVVDLPASSMPCDGLTAIVGPQGSEVPARWREMVHLAATSQTLLKETLFFALHPTRMRPKSR
mmetsp:Transcript_24275/g.54607  ORF Transcript_24275/g.54607 Transcript_24275/m.54607 type:complete len:233 (+) Transcript_24275:3981-4679(+)